MAVYPKAVGGSITAAGTATKRAARKLTGSTTATGIVVKGSSRRLVGSVTGTGVHRKLMARTLYGLVSPTAARSKNVRVRRDGAVPAQGSLDRLAGRVRTLTGSITAAGVTRKVASRRHTGSITPTAVTGRRAQKKPRGTIAPVGAIALSVARRVFGRSGVVTIKLGPAAEVETTFYLRHRCQVTIGPAGTAE